MYYVTREGGELVICVQTCLCIKQLLLSKCLVCAMIHFFAMLKLKPFGCQTLILV